MYQKIRAELQIFVVLASVTAILAFLSLTIKTDHQAPASVQSASQSNSTLLQATEGYTYYLPLVQKFPTPTPPPYIFFDNFSDDDSGWAVYSSNDCEVGYSSGEYRLYVEDDSDSDDQCFGAGPEETEHRYGTFEVQARRNDGSDHYRYGIYINGKGGGEYYLFWIEHDGSNCSYALIRRASGSDSTKRSGDCDAYTNGNANPNLLKIKHTSTKVLTIYLNNTQLATYTDDSHLTGEGTGVYVRELDNNDDLTVRFDNFGIGNP
jgi:hypothetical protein